MIMCICRNITSLEVEELAKANGITGLEALTLLLKERGTGCGTCDDGLENDTFPTTLDNYE